MNVFVLDKDPVLAAQMQCDKHVIKMALESVQLLCSVYPPNYPGLPVKVTHRNHPSAEWARHTTANHTWLLQHSKALFKEYTYRYKREHALSHAPAWVERTPVSLYVGSETYNPPAPRFVFVGPAGYEGDDYAVVAAYRRYYMMEKRRFATYTRRSPPDWFKQALADPPTVPIKAKGRKALLLGIPSTIKHTFALLSLYDAHLPGMPAFGSKPLKIWYDGTTDSPYYELAPHSMQVLKKLREYA